MGEFLYTVGNTNIPRQLLKAILSASLELGKLMDLFNC